MSGTMALTLAMITTSVLHGAPAQAAVELLSERVPLQPGGMSLDAQAGAISRDGRIVVYQSASSDLVAVPTGVRFNVYAHDRAAGMTTLVSIDRTGTRDGNGPSDQATTSPDGRFILFHSSASDLVDDFVDGNPVRDAFVRDLLLGTTTLVSRNSAGTASANAGGTGIAISDDGRYVLLHSQSTDVVADGFEGQAPSDKSYCYRRDLQSGTTELVSINVDGAPSALGNTTVRNRAYMSADGRYVVFSSGAADLVAPGIDANGREDVFVRDMVAGTTALLSVNGAGNAADGRSTEPQISADGRLVTFLSFASDVVDGFVDGNGPNQMGGDVYVRDLASGVTTLVSVNAAGTASGNATSLEFDFHYSFSRDGRYVAFRSRATDLVVGVSDTTDSVDVFVRDLAMGRTILASVDASGTTAGGAGPGLLSPDGGAVAFPSAANTLVPGFVDRNGPAGNIFVRDIASGITTLVSGRPGTTDGADREVGLGGIGSGGRAIAFSTAAQNLDPSDTNTLLDVYLYTAAATAVVGDCSGDGSVTVDELIRGVNIVLGTLPLNACSSFDANGDGVVTIDEMVRGVANALGAG